ncbi:hypothetical protein DSL64_26710 [Dyadobacter luteus]|uniref:Response regulatory domain-containing protein n=1 Tax=Dyadobacter luteus TaxID=2259619 RepID=A0A3D8Y485_9BACT|nr:hypothetical protein [Dyadobacter luteus]REA56512.1 hypothetical protein DSL64_26710 [Dyadobacter luteus]
MKKLFFFDQIKENKDIGFLPHHWRLERVGTISEVLNHPFFCMSGEKPDVFMARPGSPVSEMAVFLRYLKRHRPNVPFVLVIHDDRHEEVWRTLLKGVDILLLKRASVSGYLDHFTNAMSKHIQTS